MKLSRTEQRILREAKQSVEKLVRLLDVHGYLATLKARGDCQERALWFLNELTKLEAELVPDNHVLAPEPTKPRKTQGLDREDDAEIKARILALREGRLID